MPHAPRRPPPSAAGRPLPFVPLIRLPLGFGTRLPSGALYGEAILAPTVLYSPVTEALAAAGIVPHYCANITGHGWRKVMRHPGSFTYRIRTLPPVPEVLQFLVEQTGNDLREAYGNLNMGAGFALYVAAADAERTAAIARHHGIEAWIAGTVEAGPKQVVLEPLGITYGADDLHVRA